MAYIYTVSQYFLAICMSMLCSIFGQWRYTEIKNLNLEIHVGPTCNILWTSYLDNSAGEKKTIQIHTTCTVNQITMAFGEHKLVPKLLEF